MDDDFELEENNSESDFYSNIFDNPWDTRGGTLTLQEDKTSKVETFWFYHRYI